MAAFRDIADVYVDHLCPGSVFCVKTKHKTLRLMASQPPTMRVWVEVIFTGAGANTIYGEAKGEGQYSGNV